MRSLIVGQLQIKADLSSQATPKPGHVHDAHAWSAVTDRHGTEIAKLTGQRAETVRDFGRVHGERESPTSKAIRTLRAALQCGVPESDVLAVVELIPNEFGRVTVPRVGVLGRAVSHAELGRKALCEIGEVISEISMGIGDANYTPEEKAITRKAIREAIDALIAYEAQLDKA